MPNYLFAAGPVGRGRLSMTLIGTDGITFPGNLIRIRYVDGMRTRRFGLYAYTDGNGVIVERGAAGESAILEKTRIYPHEPMASATAVLLPDGRVFVDENRLTVGNSDKQLLHNLKEIIPQLYQDMGEAIRKAIASGG